MVHIKVIFFQIQKSSLDLFVQAHLQTILNYKAIKYVLLIIS